MSDAPDDPAASLMEQAYAQLAEGAVEQAVESFTAALCLAPQSLEAFRGRAQANFQLKAWPQAASDFDRARQLDPDDRENWVGCAMSLAMDNKVYEAIDVFETLLTRHPGYARGHLQLGLLYFQLCITDKGRQHLETALACDPTLEERRLIQDVLQRERKLDTGRYYRPDFEALHRQEQARMSVLAQWMRRLRMWWHGKNVR